MFAFFSRSLPNPQRVRCNAQAYLLSSSYPRLVCFSSESRSIERNVNSSTPATQSAGTGDTLLGKRTPRFRSKRSNLDGWECIGLFVAKREMGTTKASCLIFCSSVHRWQRRSFPCCHSYRLRSYRGSYGSVTDRMEIAITLRNVA